MEEGKDFIINPDGSVTLSDWKEPVKSKEQQAEDAQEAEYNQLVYDMSHPERFSAEEMAAKKERREELHKILGKDKFIQNKAGKLQDASARMREQLRAKLKQQQSGPSLADIAMQQKQND